MPTYTSKLEKLSKKNYLVFDLPFLLFPDLIEIRLYTDIYRGGIIEVRITIIQIREKKINNRIYSTAHSQLFHTER